MYVETIKSEEPFKFNVRKKHANNELSVNPVENPTFYNGNVEELIKLLNDSLATELVCALRYKHHYFTSKGIHAGSIADEFKAHATEELAHADVIAERIVQLGGEPDFTPNTLTYRSHADYVPTTNLQEMIKENLVAERIAVHSYLALIRYIGENDLTTRSMLEDILAQEEAHADELANWVTLS
jgi:bacterioferritin